METLSDFLQLRRADEAADPGEHSIETMQESKLRDREMQRRISKLLVRVLFRQLGEW